MNKEKTGEGLKISIPLITNEELENISKYQNELVEEISKTIVHDKDLLILQQIIKNQQAEIKAYKDKLKELKKYIKENYFLLHFCEGIQSLMYYKDFKKFRDDILKIIKRR